MQTRIVEQARKLQESNEDNTAGEQAMRKEFEQLLTVITSPRELDPNEIKYAACFSFKFIKK